MTTKTNWTGRLLPGIGALVALMAGYLGGYHNQPPPRTIAVEVIRTVKVPVEIIKTVPAEAPKLAPAKRKRVAKPKAVEEPKKFLGIF